jgi:hypothetical protein
LLRETEQPDARFGTILEGRFVAPPFSGGVPRARKVEALRAPAPRRANPASFRMRSVLRAFTRQMPKAGSTCWRASHVWNAARRADTQVVGKSGSGVSADQPARGRKAAASVRNSWPHSSHDQVWRIRPWPRNSAALDASSVSPQCGQAGIRDSREGWNSLVVSQCKPMTLSPFFLRFLVGQHASRRA